MIAVGSDVEAIWIGIGHTASASDWLAMLLVFVASAAVTWMFHVPYSAGTPLSVAVERLNWTPAGRAPAIDHAYSPPPPVAASVSAIDAPTVARGRLVVVMRIAFIDGGVPASADAAAFSISAMFAPRS